MDAQNKASNSLTDGKVIIATLLLVGGLIMIYLSGVFFAFNWRVANEPGFTTVWGLLIPAIFLCGVGGLLFVGGHVYLFIRRSKLIFLAWGVCVVVTIGAVSLAPILLLFMV